MKKKLMYPLSAVSLSLLLVACSGQNTQTLSPEEEIVKGAEEEQAAVNRETEVQKAGNAAWSYEGETGPEHWGDLDPAYSACANGSEQSPINIEFSQVKEGKEMEAINIQYEPTTFSLVHNGHTVQANAASESNRIIVEEHEYKLAQFHFHTPSEHTFNNENYDMELHL
ncbi:MAG TPA: carbonic anhydrase family protein, partial [Chondromyces sp.]|nr:carbonic anhydrase family protein [Chondromyces sp.]